MEKKIIRIGNSTGIIIPKSVLSQLDLQEGSVVIIEQDAASGSLVITKKGTKTPATSITPRFLKILDKVNAEYATAFKELAEQ